MDNSIEQPTTQALEWARRLVRVPTVSSDSNLPLIEIVADYLRSVGVPIRLTYNGDRTKANIFATIGIGKPGGVVLSGHTDTVPWEGQAWSRDPTCADVVSVGGSDRLYGRGSADMKGFIGIVIAQTRTWLDADLPFAIHYAFSYDEEVGCFGAQELLADLKEADLRPAICIVGEPTSMVPAVAHKGAYRWRCCVRGKAVHSSLAPSGVNAIEAAAKVISHISAMNSNWRANEQPQEGFDVPYSTAAVCQVHGGIADNIVPEDCRFHYEFRLLPGADAERVQRLVMDYVETIEPAMHSTSKTSGFRFEPIIAVPAFQARLDDPAVQLSLRLARTNQTTLVAFGTEAGLFQRAGMSTVVCGPGSIEQAHQADEYVTLAQLARCERFLLGLSDITSPDLAAQTIAGPLS